MNIYSHLRTSVAILTTIITCQMQGQIMISYDGNDTKDMVASVKWIDNTESEEYVFNYNADRTLKSLQFTGIYGSETETASFNYSWSEGNLQLTGNINGEDIETIDLSLNAAHYATNDYSCETKYDFTYDQAGYMSSFTEDGYSATTTWENGNLKEYTLSDYKRTFTYGNTINTTNIDFGVHSLAVEGFFCLPIGKWSKNLPTNIKEYLGGQLSYDGNFEYTFDEKQRVAKINVNVKEYEDNGESDSYSVTIEITYDENFISSVQKVTTENEAEAIYDISGRPLQSVGRGLNVIRSNKGKARKYLFVGK
ncbi:MAG: hypothetical protein ACI4B3_06825 [Prevotella sp.]